MRIYENKDELKNEINKSLLNEVYTNKATTEYRETKLANLRVIIRKPYCEIDTENVATLQFLDLIKEVVDILQWSKAIFLKFLHFSMIFSKRKTPM